MNLHHHTVEERTALAPIVGYFSSRTNSPRRHSTNLKGPVPIGLLALGWVLMSPVP